MYGDAILPDALPASTAAPIRLFEVELSSEIEPLDLNDASAGPARSALVLVRLHGQPLGTVLFEAADGVVKPQDCISEVSASLRALIADHLRHDGLEDGAELGPQGIAADGRPQCLLDRDETMAKAPLVTVVVATHDRPDSLRSCLDSLTRLAYPRFEIVVVVNAPPPSADFQAVAASYEEDPRIRWLQEQRQGACRARNRGIFAAEGEIIAFCDDDVTHDPNWLVEIVRGFDAGPRVGCVTGLAYPAELETDAQLWFEQYGGFGAGFTPRLFDLADNRPDDPLYPFRPAIFGVGTNMAFKTQVIRQLGGFDPALGPGTPTGSGEDYALYYHTLQQGFAIAYQPGAIVYHRHRRDYDSLREQVYGYAVGYGAALARTALAHPMTAWDLARNLPRGIASLTHAKREYRDRPSFPAEFSDLEVKGLLAGPALFLLSKYRVSRRVRLSSRASVAFSTPYPAGRPRVDQSKESGPAC